MKFQRGEFWGEVLAVHGSVTPLVTQRVLVFGLWATVVWAIATSLNIKVELDVTPYEFVGAVMALLLVLRTNSGYDRWYEGRKLWGGIVNQSRNLGIIGVAYGPKNAEWRNLYLRWAAAFPHLARHSLREERDLSDLQDLLPANEIRELQQANHLPSYGSLRLAQILNDAREKNQMDGFAFTRAEEQRGQLIDFIGSCERIKKTPLAKVMSIKVRHFLFLYLLILPLAIIDRSGILTPLLTMLIAYPLLSLDQIGIELENPFSARKLSHLPLNRISSDLEGNIMALENIPELMRQTGWNGAPTSKVVRMPEANVVH